MNLNLQTLKIREFHEMYLFKKERENFMLYKNNKMSKNIKREKLDMYS